MFFLLIKSFMSLEAKKRLLSTTFMSVLDYGNAIYMNAILTCIGYSLPWRIKVHHKP